MTDPYGTFRLDGLLPATTISMRAELNGVESDVVTIAGVSPGFEQSGIVLRMP